MMFPPVFTNPSQNRRMSAHQFPNSPSTNANRGMTSAQMGCEDKLVVRLPPSTLPGLNTPLRNSYPCVRRSLPCIARMYSEENTALPECARSINPPEPVMSVSTWIRTLYPTFEYQNVPQSTRPRVIHLYPPPTQHTSTQEHLEDTQEEDVEVRPQSPTEYGRITALFPSMLYDIPGVRYVESNYIDSDSDSDSGSYQDDDSDDDSDDVDSEVDDGFLQDMLQSNDRAFDLSPARRSSPVKSFKSFSSFVMVRSKPTPMDVWNQRRCMMHHNRGAVFPSPIPPDGVETPWGRLKAAQMRIHMEMKIHDSNLPHSRMVYQRFSPDYYRNISRSEFDRIMEIAPPKLTSWPTFYGRPG